MIGFKEAIQQGVPLMAHDACTSLARLEKTPGHAGLPLTCSFSVRSFRRWTIDPEVFFGGSFRRSPSGVD